MELNHAAFTASAFQTIGTSWIKPQFVTHQAWLNTFVNMINQKAFHTCFRLSISYNVNKIQTMQYLTRQTYYKPQTQTKPITEFYFS
jgi:hypothetical protein